MATNNPKTAANQITVTRFGGITDHAGLSIDSAADVRNFRILSDGTLEKRCGYTRSYTFSQPLRGLWEGVVSGESYLFAVAGNVIYMRAPDATTPSAIYTMTTSTGGVSFFLYRERLWLMDGKSLLVFRPGTRSFSIAQGYVPLYGYNWHPTSLGEINEPLNLVRNEIRVHYFNSNGSTTFHLPFTSKKINYVRVNGSAITTYTFQPGTSSFTIPTAYATVGSVEVHVTLDPIFSGRTSVLEASYAKVYHTPEREVMMCHGSRAGYLVYRTSPVSDEMLRTCDLTVADTDPMYVAKDTAFAVGSSTHPVTALCQFEDQMLVFNDDSIWSVRYPEADSDEAEIFPVRSGLGCTSRNGVMMCGKYPIAATGAGIARLKFSSTDPDYCQPEILSANIREKLGREFLENAMLFWDESRQELWVRDPNDSAGSVWICAPERGIWFRFDNLFARSFFPLEGGIGFTEYQAVCVFDEQALNDGGAAITAEYRSHDLAIAPVGAPRRSLRVSMVAQHHDNRIVANIQTDRGSCMLKLRGQAADSGSLTFYNRRATMGRFRFLQFVIAASNQKRSRIYSFSITANP